MSFENGIIQDLSFFQRFSGENMLMLYLLFTSDAFTYLDGNSRDGSKQEKPLNFYPQYLLSTSGGEITFSKKSWQ